MTSIIDRITNMLPGKRKGWLSDLKEKDHEVIQKLVDTGVGNKSNYLRLMLEPKSDSYWIGHRVGRGMADWTEYQPITHEQAQALKDHPEKWRVFVLHDWIDS